MSDFNLIYKKWIPCVMKHDLKDENSSANETFSLLEILTQAREISEITGENPLITISLYRLLLAILHDIFQGPKDVDEWGSIWGRGHFDKDLVEKYFEENSNNFFLFHDEKPFYQTANFSHKADDKPTWKFFLEGEGFATVFEHTNLEKPPNFSYSEAARYLVAFQNFDVGGTQSGERKNLTKEEKNLVSFAYASLLNKCAIGLVKGENLFKTLMLNLTQYNRAFGIPFPRREITKDLPAWKNNEPIDPKNNSSPQFYLNLLTWQSRQIRLKPDEENKTIQKVVVMKGNQIADLSELHKKEQMVAFRKIEKKGWFPIFFQREKALWRDSFSLFHTIEEKSSRPEILDWLNDLVANGKLDKDTVFPFDFFGLCVNQAKPLFWRHERLPLPLKYLSDTELCKELGEALRIAEATASLLSQSIYRTTILYYLPESRFEVGDWYKPFCSKDAIKTFDEYKKSRSVKDKFKVVKGKPIGEIPMLAKTLAPELRYWSRLETPFRKHLLELAKGKTLWKTQRGVWAKDILLNIALLAFSESTQSLGNSPNALRAVSISQSWLKAELNMRKKKFLDFEPIEDEELKTEENEEEESE